MQIVTSDKEGKFSPLVTTSLGFDAPCGDVSADTKPEVVHTDIRREDHTLSAASTARAVATTTAVGKRLSKSGGEGEDASDDEGDGYFDDVSLSKLKEKHSRSDDGSDDREEQSGGGQVRGMDNENNDGNGNDSDSEGDDDDAQRPFTGRDRLQAVVDKHLYSNHEDSFSPAETHRSGLKTLSKRNHTPYHAPFQPSSTIKQKTSRDTPEDGLTDEGGKRQWEYLVWNSVGSVTSLNEDTNNRIEITFSDVQGECDWPVLCWEL